MQNYCEKHPSQFTRAQSDVSRIASFVRSMVQKPPHSSFTVMNDKGNKSTHLKSSKCLTNLLKKIIK